MVDESDRDTQDLILDDQMRGSQSSVFPRPQPRHCSAAQHAGGQEQLSLDFERQQAAGKDRGAENYTEAGESRE
jgi:hypothetical protein